MASSRGPAHVNSQKGTASSKLRRQAQHTGQTSEWVHCMCRMCCAAKHDTYLTNVHNEVSRRYRSTGKASTQTRTVVNRAKDNHAETPLLTLCAATSTHRRTSFDARLTMWPALTWATLALLSRSTFAWMAATTCMRMSKPAFMPTLQVQAGSQKDVHVMPRGICSSTYGTHQPCHYALSMNNGKCLQNSFTPHYNTALASLQPQRRAIQPTASLATHQKNWWCTTVMAMPPEATHSAHSQPCHTGPATPAASSSSQRRK